MAKKTIQNNIIGVLIGGFITLLIVFIGPLRTMATQKDIKDFITKEDISTVISKNTYIEDKRLIMDHIDRLNQLTKQMELLAQEMAVLKIEIKHLREELPKEKG